LQTIKFDKKECGVEVLIRAGAGDELKDNYIDTDVYKTDFFEILIFKKATGHLVLNERKITITDNVIVFISPYQKRQWKLDPKELDFTFVIFQEDFLNDFFSDKLFTYRLLYFYQLDYPWSMNSSTEDIQKICLFLTEINAELKKTRLDSEHIIRSLLYYVLLKLNRDYALIHKLPLEKPENNYAYEYKKLLEVHVKEKQRVSEYAELLGISRITLNKAVQAQFGITAAICLNNDYCLRLKTTSSIQT
jgi:AraC family transcriptional activator of pobA